MSTLTKQGQRLLELLVSRLPSSNPARPETFITYKEAHDALGLIQVGQTYGLSLKHQGLATLAEWTANEGLPAVTGLIVNGQDRMPGQGYFRLFGRSENDFPWWEAQIQESKKYDWQPFLPELKLPFTPRPPDAAKPPERIETHTFRVLRDTQIALRVKRLHDYECQICRTTICLPDGRRYAEAHHIKPLGRPHNGPDVFENVLCLCPNHHAELDYGVRRLVVEALRLVPGHRIGEEFIVYHNESILHTQIPSKIG